MAYFFVVLSNKKNIRRQIVWWNSYSGIYLRSWKIISVTPNRLLKTQNSEKKGKLSSEQKFLNKYSWIMEYVKPQETIYEGP